MKTVETMLIESVLMDACFGEHPSLAKKYGAIEVKIGFPRNYGGTGEYVDFITYDPRADMFDCYEIKVSMSDFNSKAKKSWHGHRNYLVISHGLYAERTKEEWCKMVPEHVGIQVINTNTIGKTIIKKAKIVDVSDDMRTILKDSMLRSLFYQNCKPDFYLRNMMRKNQPKDNLDDCLF